MPTAYSYIRYSRPEQLRGDSLRRQLETSQRYIDEHGLTLDTTLKMQDLGISAFRGANIKPDAALGGFIAAIDSGRVLPGSYLLVESLDRLSREPTAIALNLFLSILNKDILIVTTIDNKLYTKESINDLGEIITSIVKMAQAHEESQKKKNRGNENWANKRNRATTATHKLTRRCPAWLQLNDEHNHFTVIPHRGLLIQRIYGMCIDGHGAPSIMRQLNGEGIPTWNNSDGWHTSYIQTILHTPAVYGEFTPEKIDKTKLEPIANYFPTVISKDTFLQAQYAMAQRTGRGGRPGGEINLFSTLLRCGKCRGSLVRLNKGRHSLPFFACDKGRRGLSDCKYAPWSVADAETHILTELHELTSITPPEEDTEIKTIRSQQTSLSVERDRIQAQLTRLEDFVINGNELTTGLLKRMQSMETEILAFDTKALALDTALHQAMLKQTNTRAASDYIQALRSEPDDRIKLRSHIRELVDHIVLFLSPISKATIYLRSDDYEQKVRIIMSKGKRRSILMTRDQLPA